MLLQLCAVRADQARVMLMVQKVFSASSQVHVNGPSAIYNWRTGQCLSHLVLWGTVAWDLVLERVYHFTYLFINAEIALQCSSWALTLPFSVTMGLLPAIHPAALLLTFLSCPPTTHLCSFLVHLRTALSRKVVITVLNCC